MWTIVRHELKSGHIYSVHGQDDTGQHSVEFLIQAVLTGEYYDLSKLQPIYDAYTRLDLDKKGSSWKLQKAIGEGRGVSKANPVKLD